MIGYGLTISKYISFNLNNIKNFFEAKKQTYLHALLEEWQSGRMRQSRKLLRVTPPGFESLFLRKYNNPFKMLFF